MAYDKHTWTCDEPITVERLNHMEEGIANAGGDCGYECEEGMVTLTEETVTTELDGDAAYGDLSYSQRIDAESIKVTFNGTVYECEGVEGDHGYTYGALYDINLNAWDWSEYPFQISSLEIPSGIRNSFATATAGTHTIKIETVEETVTTTPCFDLARGYSCSEMVEVLDDETVITVHNDKGGYNRGSIDLTLAEPFPQLTITFDNVKYECEINGNGAYGSTSYITFSEYPFRILPSGLIYTSTPGEHSVKVEQVETFVTTTPCFEKAVRKVAPPTDISPLILTQSGSPAQLNKTFEEIGAAYLSGRTVLLDPPNVSNLKVSSGKNYYSMVSLEINSALGDPQSGRGIVFGGKTTRVFSASSGSDYPTSAE